MSTSKSTHSFSFDRNKINFPYGSKYCDLTMYVETPCFEIGVDNGI